MSKFLVMVRASWVPTSNDSIVICMHRSYFSVTGCMPKKSPKLYKPFVFVSTSWCSDWLDMHWLCASLFQVPVYRWFNCSRAWKRLQRYYSFPRMKTAAEGQREDFSCMKTAAEVLQLSIHGPLNSSSRQYCDLYAYEQVSGDGACQLSPHRQWLLHASEWFLSGWVHAKKRVANFANPLFS